MTAHQKTIRDDRAANDHGDLFGKYWESVDCDIANAVIKEIDIATAAKIIEEYEWLGTMPAVVLHCFGLFFSGVCGGAVVYSPEYAENLGVWDRYGYTGKLILLSRGACAHWAHEHSASKLIRGSMRMLPKKYRVVTATVDAEAGEIGTIYQACGFDFVGVMSAGGKRSSLVETNGKRLSGRQLGRLFGTRGHKALEGLGIHVEAVGRKARYFGFRGNRKEVDRLRDPILSLVKQYPKRGKEQA